MGAPLFVGAVLQLALGSPWMSSRQLAKRPVHWPLCRAPLQAKSTLDILRQLLVFQACKVRPLVTNADALLGWSKRVLGEKLVYNLIRPTFYKQVRMRSRQQKLRSACWPHVLLSRCPHACCSAAVAALASVPRCPAPHPWLPDPPAPVCHAVCGR